MKRCFSLITVILFAFGINAQPVAPQNNLPAIPNVFTPVAGFPLGTMYVCNGCYRNFIRTYSMQRPITQPSAIDLSLSTITTTTPIATQYFNGLGLPLQDVYNAGGPTYTDVVLLHPFDWTGKKQNECLPYAISDAGNTVKLKTAPFTQYTSFYHGKYVGEYPYSRILTDQYAPLDRPTKILPPGKNWIGSNRGINLSYSGNPEYVAKWGIANTSGSIPVFEGYYSDGSLYETKTEDEDGNVYYEYKDKNDRLILKRQVIVSSVSTPFDPQDYAQTYYVYDIFGRLRTTISPEAVKKSLTSAWQTTWSLTQTIVDNLCFSYSYDERGRVISKKVPGKEVEYFVYDVRDRQVFYQDGNLRKAGKWLSSIYDINDQVIGTALYSTNNSQTTLTQQVKGNVPGVSYNTPFTLFYYLGPNAATKRNPFTLLNLLTDAELISRYYYDDYNYSGFSMVSYDNSLNSRLINYSLFTSIPNKSNQTRGMKTCESHRLQQPDGTYSPLWYWSANFYDDKGRMIQSQEVYPSGTLTTTNQYYFSGQLACKAVKMYYNAPQNPQQQTTYLTNTHYYNFRIVQRTSTTQQINNGPHISINQFTYDELGRVSKKAMAASFGGGFEENYTYNIRGWLTGINPDYVDNNTTPGIFGPFFGEKISYDNGFASKLYNGNIAGVQWRGGQAGSRKQFYGYSYDKLNRLTHAEYGVWNNGSWLQNATTDFNYTTTNIAYDNNGNLQSMKHYGPMSGPGGTIYGVMDDLTYGYYANTNRLSHVNDAVNSSNNLPKNVTPDFRDAAGIDYDYDENGNLKKDGNKNITSITYSLQNKPLKVLFSSGDVVEYVYMSTGEKLQKIVTSASGVTTYNYIDDFIWKNDNIEYIIHEEGRARPTSDPDKYDYDFFIKDHLKNVRTVVSTQAINYYPPLVQTANTTGVSTDPPAPPPPPVISDPEGKEVNYLASMEVASANYEGLLWNSLDEVRDDKPLSTDPNDIAAARLNGEEEDRRIGTALLLRVMPGDRFSLSANNYYSKGSEEGESALSGEEVVDALYSTLLGGTVGYNPVSENAESIDIINSTVISSGLSSVINNIQEQNFDPDKPASHLNYVVFDENAHILEEVSGALQASGMDYWQQKSAGEIKISQPGYLLVFTTARMFKNVYWDAINLVHYKGTAVEENHYYPFGLTLNAANPSSGVPLSDIRYNSKKLERDEFGNGLGLDWYDYGARAYDPQIGRWNQVDMLAHKMSSLSPYSFCFNNPLKFIDPTGEIPTPVEGARIAGHIYDGKIGDVLEGGWRLDKVYTNSKNSAYRSGLYSRTVDGVTEYAMANAGTYFENSKRGRGSMSEDVEQPFGGSENMRVSIATAKQVSKDVGDKELTFVGHSKGGAEAAGNALATNRNALLYNPAAINAEAYGLDAKSYTGADKNGMTAFVVKGDMLNSFINHFFAKPIDNVVYLPQQSKNPVTNHLINTMIKALQQYYKTNEQK